MKATLEFNLDDYSDKIHHLRAVQSLNLALVLFELSQKFRAIDKYDAESVTADDFYELLNKYDIHLDSIME